MFRPDTLASQPVPATLDEALDVLDRGLSGADFHRIQTLDEDDAVAALDPSVSRSQNRWLLRGAPLWRDLSRSGFEHPDDMQEAMLRSFWRQLHKQPVALADQAREANAIRAAAQLGPNWVVFAGKAAERLLHQCGRKTPSSDGWWVPDADAIWGIEAALPAALQEALDRTRPPASPRFTAGDYYRQYGGILVRGKRIVYINGFHRAAVEGLLKPLRHSLSWRTTPVMVCDGGRWFFGAEYDPETRQVRAVTFN